MQKKDLENAPDPNPIPGSVSTDTNQLIALMVGEKDEKIKKLKEKLKEVQKDRDKWRDDYYREFANHSNLKGFVDGLKGSKP